MFSFQITAFIISPRDIDTKQNDDIIESTHAHYSPPLAREDTSGILGVEEHLLVCGCLLSRGENSMFSSKAEGSMSSSPSPTTPKSPSTFRLISESEMLTPLSAASF